MNGVVEKVYQHRNDFIIIGLTGKIASGCTTAADFLTKKVDEIILPEIDIGEDSNDNIRKKYYFTILQKQLVAITRRTPKGQPLTRDKSKERGPIRQKHRPETAGILPAR